MKQICLLLFLLVVTVVAARPVYAGVCTSPAGKENDIIYSYDYHTYQFCNGTNWIAYGGGANCGAAAAGYTPTISSKVGYFIMTQTQYTGNMGGIVGADSLCFTELSSTHTGWKGYATANANGQLVATKVHAFLCIFGGLCNNLMPLTTYYFANAADSAIGGASFTTDTYGQGPNDYADWAAWNYFGGNYFYLSNRGAYADYYFSDYGGGSGLDDCSNYTSDSVFQGSNGAMSSIYTNRRFASIGLSCGGYYSLICFVNP